jgi:putative transposase
MSSMREKPTDTAPALSRARSSICARSTPRSRGDCESQRPAPEHPVYPYLLRGLTIDRPNQVWAADITYVPPSRGFAYLVVIMDWCLRRVLSWRLSNTPDSVFCVEAPNEALLRFGRPEIFNTDQGAQFTAAAFTAPLLGRSVKISMDGKMDYVDLADSGVSNIRP